MMDVDVGVLARFASMLLDDDLRVILMSSSFQSRKEKKIFCLEIRRTGQSGSVASTCIAG